MIRLIKLCLVLCLCLLVTGCGEAEAPDASNGPDETPLENDTNGTNGQDDENAKEDPVSYDEYTLELLAELMPTAFKISVSPAGDYLVSFVAGAPVDGAYIIDLETGEFSWLSCPEMPSMMGQPGRVDFSADGGKLAYSVYYFSFEEGKEPKGILCFSRAGVPPEVYHSAPLPEEHLLEDGRPAWSADQAAVYYITTAGLMEYRLAEEKSSLLYDISRLPGLLGDYMRVAPLAYSIRPEREMAAYYHNRVIRVLELGGDRGEPLEIPVDTAADSMKFSTDGSCLLLEYGGRLSLVRIDDGLTEEIARQVRSYALSPAGQLAVLTGSGGQMDLIVYDTAFQPAYRAVAPEGSYKVLWIGDRLAVLTTGDDHYPLYTVDFN